MNANDVIDSYVTDVARRLPRKQRNDVGFELRALLNEELAGRAETAGRAADEAMAYGLVREFGAPDQVADRYRPQSFTIVKPGDTRTFVLLALGGVALQWAVSLPAVFTSHAEIDPLSRFGAWWVTGGLGALWWPGFLVLIAATASWIQYRWPTQVEWKPRTVDRDEINRPLMALGLAGVVAGASLMIFLPQILQAIGLPQVAVNALVYDPGFIGTRAPFVLLVWIAQFVLYAVALAEGRWRRITRRLDIALSAATGLILVWLIAAGPIWHAAATDQVAKGIIALGVIFLAIDVALKIRRELMQLRPPALPAAHA